MNIKIKITIFHCMNVFDDHIERSAISADKAELNFVKMPCSSMVKDVFLLRAFEAGADVVAVLVCMEGACHYVEGNLRAAKRVKRIQALLDEIGLDGRRLALSHVRGGDAQAIDQAIEDCKSAAALLGPNPAAVLR